MNEPQRLLALDQSSKCTGWAVYCNEKLENYGKFTFDDSDIINRLIGIKKQIRQLFDDEDINVVAIEDIQLQANNVVTYKALAFVMAVILVICKEYGVECEIISSSTWKSICGIKGKTRVDQKKAAQRFVLEDFEIEATQDTVDAICIGYAFIKQNKSKINWQ